jgi:hypothetical protein
MTGVSKKCIMRLLLEAGAVASKYQDEAFRNLTCKRIQVDELWAFIGAKQKNVTPEIVNKNPSAGDIWLWVAIDVRHEVGSLLDARWARCGRCFPIPSRST